VTYIIEKILIERERRTKLETGMFVYCRECHLCAEIIDQYLESYTKVVCLGCAVGKAKYDKRTPIGHGFFKYE
jgi:hypothetical protein